MRVTYVHTDEQYPFAEQCHGDGEVAADKGFTFAADTRCNKYDFFVFIIEDELYVVANQTEKLCDRTVFAFTYDDMVFIFMRTNFSEDGK